MYLITGASKGMGRYILEKLIESTDEKIIALYNSTPPDMAHEQVEWHCVDLKNFESINNFVQNISGSLSAIKFINCAGINYIALTHKHPEDEWDNLIQVNLTSAFYFCKLLIPFMRQQQYGRIVFISSVVPQIGVAGTAAYSASKSGLWGLMKTIVQENASKNITCNTLNLGYFNVGMISQVPEKILEEIKTRIPAKHLGNPDDVVHALTFLVNTDYVNGSSININGGLY
jgi:NAD(P)-dependent dehydrogenase (short-subunit alcohol dehydrogenase family)